MNNKLYFACLLLGVGIGLYSGAEYYRNKYKTISDNEIESVRDSYQKAIRSLTKEPIAEKKIVKAPEKTVSSLFPGDDIPEMDFKAAKEIIKKNEYKEDASPAPYVIPPDDFGGTFEYDCVSLVYYADGVLVDDNQDVVTDIDGTIGEEALDSFGIYEDDAVYVRNDEKRCDYEVLLDERNWSDVKQKKAR